MSIEYITKSEAEKKTGLKLDGRKRYFIWDGEVCFEAKFRHACSGCSDDSEYSSGSKGAGCRECGGHGMVRGSAPIPVKYEFHVKKDQ